MDHEYPHGFCYSMGKGHQHGFGWHHRIWTFLWYSVKTSTKDINTDFCRKITTLVVVWAVDINKPSLAANTTESTRPQVTIMAMHINMS